LEKLPDALSVLNLGDAWHGGSSLQLRLSGPGSDDENAFFQCVWLPVQSLAITSGRSYEAHVVYKVNAGAEVDLDISLSLKLFSEHVQPIVQVNPILANRDAIREWSMLSIQFEIPADRISDIVIAIGLVIGFATQKPTQPYQFSILLGQMAVFPTVPSDISSYQPKLLWANFEPIPNTDDKLHGTLTWEVATSFTPLTNVVIKSPEDPSPAWILDTSATWFPSFLYFNIYLQLHSPKGSVSTPENAIFIGTTGTDGRANRFFVDPRCLPDEIAGADEVRLLVQGVTDRGDLLKWHQCVFVDISV